MPPPSSPLVTVAPRGDVVLDLTFHTSAATIRASRKALPTRSRSRPGQRDADGQPALAAQICLAYRVDLATLKKHSRYFASLLTDTRFLEARSIDATLQELALRDAKAADLEDADQLPRVSILDDDDVTRSAGREHVFRDLLRILHGGGVVTRPVTMLYVANLAAMADRFDCTAAVSRYLSSALKFKWPATPQPKASGHVEGMTTLSLAAEEMLRQKALVAWLLDQPLQFQAATRELIMFGSHRWAADDGDGNGDNDQAAPSSPSHAVSPGHEALWWFMPHELEEELHCRRTLILRTLASVISHFLRLYSSRTRQCRLGYDSSSACDSFHLGEMVRFLCSRNLLVLVNFSASPCDAAATAVQDFSAVDIKSILAALRQCPNYQVDKNHSNCGLRTKIMPILDYIEAMLSSNVVPVGLSAWRRDVSATSWAGAGAKGREAKRPVFCFTRAIALDERLRYEGAMAVDKMARALFTADGWDWTPEDDDASAGRDFPTTKWLK